MGRQPPWATPVDDPGGRGFVTVEGILRIPAAILRSAHRTQQTLVVVTTERTAGLLRRGSQTGANPNRAIGKPAAGLSARPRCRRGL
jgi:hypothetical protein